MRVQDQTGEVCVFVAELDRATTLITRADPDSLEEFSAHLNSAAGQLRALLAGGLLSPSQAADIAARVRRVNSLFQGAVAYYRGWASLAAVSESDPVPSSISVRG